MKKLIVVGLCALCAVAFAAPGAADGWDPTLAEKHAVVTNGVKWIDGKFLPIEGRAFDDVKNYYDRLPATVTKTGINHKVHQHLHNTAGMKFRFVTDARNIRIKWVPTDAKLAISHMPATGVSGVDVYRWDVTAHAWRPLPLGAYIDDPKGYTLTFKWTPGTPCLINLPLYNGIKSIELGVDPWATIEPHPYTSGLTKPVVFLGTSITHGACASRPGLAFVNMIGRDLDVPVVNLGFSGGGAMESEMCDILARIDASCYVLDAMWNMGMTKWLPRRGRNVDENYEPFIRKLRAKRPDVPIVMAERCDVTCGGPNPQDKFIRQLYNKLIAEGWKNLVYLPKTKMYTPDMEGTVDGIHPNDMGMRTMADAFGAAVKEALPPSVARAATVPQRVLNLPSSKGNPRNSEGDFAILKNGDILFIYTQYTGDSMLDHAPARLVSRVSKDKGKTWSTESIEVVANEGKQNVMSVSLLRLKDGSLALFYLRKNSNSDCRPVMRVSRDEGKTWGAPVQCVPDADVGYYVLNNNRATRLKSGRLVLPLAQHTFRTNTQMDWAAKLVCYYSDDEGATWTRGTDFATYDAAKKRITTQEPGLIELKDGRVLMYSRSVQGRQWFHYSSDGCVSWTNSVAGSLWSPCSPATITRLKNGDLLAVWNDHENRSGLAENSRQGMGIRVPLTLAISKDEGKTWINRRDLEGNAGGMYCYIAVCETDDDLLLGYISRGLRDLRVTRVPLSWMYDGVPPYKPVLFKKSVFADIKNDTPIEKLETALGTWTAQPGHAKVESAGWRKGLKLAGDKVGKKEFEVILTLPKSAPSDALNFAIYPVYVISLLVEAQFEDGSWHKVYERPEGGNSSWNLTWMNFKKLDKPVKAYRFRGKSAWGIKIVDADEFIGIKARFME